MSVIIVVLSVLFKWCISVPLPELSFWGICLAGEFFVGWAPSGWASVSEETLVIYCIVLMLLVSLHLCLSLSLCILSGCDMFELGPVTEAQTKGMTTPTNVEKLLQFQPLALRYPTVSVFKCNYTNKINTVWFWIAQQRFCGCSFRQNGAGVRFHIYHEKAKHFCGINLKFSDCFQGLLILTRVLGVASVAHNGNAPRGVSYQLELVCGRWGRGGAHLWEQRTEGKRSKVKILRRKVEKNNTFHESSWQTRSHRQDADKPKVLFTSFHIVSTFSRLVNLCIR